MRLLRDRGLDPSEAVSYLESRRGFESQRARPRDCEARPSEAWKALSGVDRVERIPGDSDPRRLALTVGSAGAGRHFLGDCGLVRNAPLTATARSAYLGSRRGTESQRARPRGCEARRSEAQALLREPTEWRAPQATRDRVVFRSGPVWHSEDHERHRPRAGRRLGPRSTRRRRRRGRRRPAARRRRRARRRICAGASGQGRRARRPRTRRRDGRAADDRRPRRPRRLLRRAALRRRHGRPGQRRADGPRAGAGHAGRDEAAVLRARVGGAVRRACRGAPAGRRPGDLSPSPANDPPLSPAPALRARGAAAQREVGHRPRRVDAPVQRADERRARAPRRHAGRGRAARRRPQPPGLPRPRRAPRHRRGRDRGAAARAAHARLRVQHAAGRQGHRRPPAPLPHVADEPQPRQ